MTEPVLGRSNAGPVVAHYLCFNCGGIAPQDDFAMLKWDDDGDLVPIESGDYDPILRCPVCQWNHTDDDSNPGLGDGDGRGTREACEAERVEALADFGDAWADAQASEAFMAGARAARENARELAAERSTFAARLTPDQVEEAVARSLGQTEQYREIMRELAIDHDRVWLERRLSRERGTPPMTDEPMPPSEFLEGEAGGRHHRAVVLLDAQGNCEAAYEEFRHDEDFPADVLAALKLVAEADLRV